MNKVNKTLFMVDLECLEQMLKESLLTVRKDNFVLE